MWEAFKTYLFVEVKLRESSKNIGNKKSLFIALSKFFESKEFTRDNFTLYIKTLKESGKSTSYLNNIIKLAKHYDKFNGFNIIQDYTYFKEKYARKEPLTPEEVYLLAKIKYPYKRLKKERNLRDYIMIAFLYMTACRMGELQDLLWADVLDSPIPNVTFRDTKTDDDRTVPITEKMYKDLMSLPKYGDRVFNNRYGRKFYAQEFNIMIKKRAEIAKINKKVHAHIFRHSRLTYLGNVVKVPIRQLMELAGHKRMDTTATYIHTFLQELSYTAYSTPFEKEILPPDTFVDMVKEYLNRILKARKQFINIVRLPNNEFDFQIRNIN